MLERIDTMNRNSATGNGANLLKDHVFQFDFLNDEFTKLPKPLQEIINNPEKRKKLVIYINPPYAEAGSVSVTDARKNKTSVATQTEIWNKYKDRLGLAIRELFVQFIIRIIHEIPDSKLAIFSKLKYINGDGFNHFRELFNPQFKSGFIVQADTFDNVTGHFPIGFIIWNLENKNGSKQIETYVYDKFGINIGKKNFYKNKDVKRITDWITQFGVKNKTNVIGYTGNNGPDFQNNNYCYLSSIHKINSNGSPNNATKYGITEINLIPICVYFSIRHCNEATWLNDRDQYLYPNDGWREDTEFQNDCLAYALFHGQNQVSSKYGTNHWIPFTEYEVGSREKFDSNFMTDYIKGKKDFNLPQVPNLRKVENVEITNLLPEKETRTTPLKFSDEATAVFNTGRFLWRYYHSTINSPSMLAGRVGVGSVNASLYDIREHFQGRNPAGKMNNKSDDVKYMSLIGDLRDKLKILAKNIEPKVYEYEFLKV
jgi:hypothetical protein